MSEPSRRWISARRFGREARLGAVVHGAERHAVVVERGDRVAQREDLEAARVGEDRPAPAGERVDPAELLDDRLAGSEVEVVRVGEDDVGAERAHLVRVERLDGSLRPDGHEGRRPDLPVRRGEHAGASRAVGRVERKLTAPARSDARPGATPRLHPL